MTAAEVSSLVLYASAMSFSPGPNTTLSAAIGANTGLRSALPFVLAVPVGWSLILVTWTVGFSTFAATSSLRQALAVAAAAYMLWLSWQVFHRTSLPHARSTPVRIGFPLGVLLQFANGKAWLNAATVAATWVTHDGQHWSRLAYVLPLMAAFGLSSNFTYAAAGTALRHWLSSGHRLRVFNGFLAALLAVTAFWVLARGAA